MDELAAEVSDAIRDATDAAEGAATEEAELREYESFATEVVWGLDRTARELTGLRAEVGGGLCVCVFSVFFVGEGVC